MYSNTKLNIIGSGNIEQYTNLARTLNIHQSIIFHGAQSKQYICNIMNKSRLLVISSFMENSPSVIGEAYCCGLPVVATDVGGVKELIIEGGVVPPKSPELLANKIIEVLESEFDREAIAGAAKKIFSYEAIGHQIYEVYQKIIK